MVWSPDSRRCESTPDVISCIIERDETKDVSVVVYHRVIVYYRSAGLVPGVPPVFCPNESGHAQTALRLSLPVLPLPSALYRASTCFLFVCTDDGVWSAMVVHVSSCAAYRKVDSGPQQQNVGNVPRPSLSSSTLTLLTHAGHAKLL